METTKFNPTGYTVQYGFPAYRVFIFGQEITADVLAVNVQWGVGVQPGVCQLTIANKNWRYNITHNDMLQIAKYRSVDPTILSKLVDNTMPAALRIPAKDVLALTTDYVAFNPLGADDAAHDPTNTYKRIKQNVVMAKLNAGDAKLPKNAQGTPDDLFTRGEEVTEGQASTNLPTPAYRYHFQVGKFIFHPMDPVRVFERDPYDPSIWYYMFSGFITDIASNVQPTGDSILTIGCEQPSKWLRYARFNMNPGFTDISQVEVRQGVLADVSFYSAFKTGLAKLTLPEIMFALMFGINAFGKSFGTRIFDNLHRRAGAIDINNSVIGQELVSRAEVPDLISQNVYCAHGSSNITTRKWGIGNIRLDGSKIFIYGPSPASTTVGATPNDPNAGLPLAMGDPTLLSQESGKDLAIYQRAIDNVVRWEDVRAMSAEFVIATGEITATQEAMNNVNQYTPIADIITIIGTRSDIFPVDGGRLFMLLPRDVAGQNASVTSWAFNNSFAVVTEWASRADVLSDILERIEFVWYVTPRGDYVVEMPLYDFDPTQFDTYGLSWDIPLQDMIAINSTFTDQNMYTQAVAYPEFISQLPLEGANQFGRNQAVTLWHLLGTYGVRQVPIQPRGYIATDPAARYYAHICLNRANAKVFTQSAFIVPNLRVWPNRPMMINMIDHYGTVQNVTQNITWGTPGDMSTIVDLAYMRGWDGIIDQLTGQKRYFTVGGMMGRPLNYSMMFDPNPPLLVPIPSGTGEH